MGKLRPIPALWPASYAFLGKLCKQKAGWNVNSNRLRSEIMLGRLRLRALEEEAAAKVVVPGDQERGNGLHGLVADAQKRDAHKHV